MHLIERNTIAIWPPKYHWDQHSCPYSGMQSESYKNNFNGFETDLSIREVSSIDSSNLIHLSKNKNKVSFNNSIIVEENSLNNASLKNSFQTSSNPMIMICVNFNSELVYITLYEDINQMNGLPTFKMEVVYTFEELINLTYIIKKFNLLLLCGNSQLHLWNVEDKKIVSTYQIKLIDEPWLIVWDAVFIDSKNTLIIGLSDGTVRQLLYDPLNFTFYKSRIYQSNDEGSPIYSVNYIYSFDKVLVTNNNHIITEFSFIEEKIESSKKVTVASENKSHQTTLNNLTLNSLNKK